VLADRHLCARRTNGPHVGGAVAGDRDGATVGRDAAAMLGVSRQAALGGEDGGPLGGTNADRAMLSPRSNER
jgi:hypothetical protein